MCVCVCARARAFRVMSGLTVVYNFGSDTSEYCVRTGSAGQGSGTLPGEREGLRGNITLLVQYRRDLVYDVVRDK